MQDSTLMMFLDDDDISEDEKEAFKQAFVWCYIKAGLGEESL